MANKIKVLHIHTLPVVSGSGINTFLSMKGLDRQKYQPELACAPAGRLIRLVRDHDMAVRTFNSLVQPIHPAKDLLAVAALTLFLKRNHYHIVHTHNSKAGFIGRLAARLARVPIIVHTVHGFAFHDQEPPWRQHLFRNLECAAYYWCDKMIFISQPLIDWALRERVARPEKIVKIYSGIELEKFQPATEAARNRIRKQWGLKKNHKVMGIVSKLWEGKGHADLLRAFAEIRKEIPQARLVIVGEGDLRASLEHQASELKIGDSVIFTGFRDDIPDIVSMLDVAVLPSLFEGMGRVLLEAMAMERPVVASRVGGIPDLVDHGVNGLLVPPEDAGELAAAIKKILLDPQLGREMGRAGQKKVSEQFSADYMAQAIERVYRELMVGKGIEIETC